jgi:hypothetical protein
MRLDHPYTKILGVLYLLHGVGQLSYGADNGPVEPRTDEYPNGKEKCAESENTHDKKLDRTIKAGQVGSKNYETDSFPIKGDGAGNIKVTTAELRGEIGRFRVDRGR